MKKNILPQLKTSLYYLLGLLLFSFSSCSTYKTTSHDNDGIYSDEETQVVRSSSKEKATSPKNDKATKYENYFKKKSAKLQIAEDEVFTDVDGYESDIDEADLERENDDFSYENSSWEDTN